jgi:hypothetical protein
MTLFLISVYIGGEITFTSQSGADYTLDPRLTFSINENITFEQVKYEIFQGLGFEQSQYSIDIQCRINIAPMGYFYFNLIIIYGESCWKITSQMAISKMEIVQLYVRMNLVQNNWRNEVIMGNQSGGSNAPVLTSQQSNIDNYLNITSQPANNTLNCAQLGGSNYLPIPTDQEKEEDNDDYNVESENSDNFSKDLDVELED